MAPKVQVPMDFGIKYLNSPSHCNLKFCLSEGGEITANSVIISYNSPVIDKLTTDLLQTSLDVQEFTREVVNNFIESCYSGEPQNISKDNFREMNKISHVFDVSWLLDRCCEFFHSLINEINSENYEQQLFAFEEAMYVFSTLKKRNFVDMVIEKFSNEITKSEQFFVTEYLVDFSSRSLNELSVIIEMTGNHKHVLLESLVKNLEKQSNKFDENSKFLLKNVRFTSCFKTNKALFLKFYDSLASIESPSKDDFELMLELFKKSEQTLSALQLQDKASILPNLFLGFDAIKKQETFSNLLEFLVSSPLVVNSIIFFDAVLTWLIEYQIKESAFHVTFKIEDFNRVLSERILKQNWSPLYSDYVANVFEEEFFVSILNSLQKNEANLTTSDGYTRLCSATEYSVSEFFSQDNEIKFTFDDEPSILCCDRIGKCGVILRTTGLEKSTFKAGSESSKSNDECSDLNNKRDQGENSFNIQLLIDPEQYPLDIHFHGESVSAANIHFTICCEEEEFPATWWDKPYKDRTGKYFIWGICRFYKNKDIRPPSSESYRWICNIDPDTKIRPIIYINYK